MTSVNAPCPSVGPSLTANPNPIPVADNAIFGQTTISWSAPDAKVVEILIGSPNGQPFALEGNRGSVQTGVWVWDGLTFYLQDVTDGKPLTSDYTLGKLVVHLQVAGQASLWKRPLWAASASAIPLLGIVLCGFLLARRQGW